MNSRVYTIPRTATPVPPSGLNYTDLPEDFEMMDDRPMLGLANAPPLFHEESEMTLDIGPNGEKRKATPPDLLTLSNMYFERNQVCFNVNIAIFKFFGLIRSVY